MLRERKGIARIRSGIDPGDCRATCAAGGNTRIARNFFCPLNEFFLEVW
jgi:hypothetical protein